MYYRVWSGKVRRKKAISKRKTQSFFFFFLKQTHFVFLIFYIFYNKSPSKLVLKTINLEKQVNLSKYVWAIFLDVKTVTQTKILFVYTESGWLSGLFTYKVVLTKGKIM